MGKYIPRFMHHATKAAVMVYSEQEEAALGPEWSRGYIHQEYPKYKYHWTEPPVIVNNRDEEAALGGGWADTPAAFDRHRGPKRGRPERNDPVKWVAEWLVPGLSTDHRKKIKAELLKAHAAWLRSPDAQSRDTASMMLAFDGIARVLFEGGLLTESLLESEIPTLVWDSAIAACWWNLGSETRQDIFPEQLGHYWVWRDESRDWNTLFSAEAAEWKGRLLESATDATADSDTPKRPASRAATELFPASSPSKRAAASRRGRTKRMPSTITSLAAARLMEQFLHDNGIAQAELAIRAGTTERTLRAFRRTGKLRRSIFDAIAREMGTTRASLLNP